MHEYCVNIKTFCNNFNYLISVIFYVFDFFYFILFIFKIIKERMGLPSATQSEISGRLIY